jgi:hypothetical protein
VPEPANKNAEKPEKRPDVTAPGEVQRNAAINSSAHQGHWKDMDRAHWLEQDESATGLFFKPGEAGKSTAKFAIDGLEGKPQTNANGKPYKTFTQPALMSPAKIDPISPELTQGAYQSPVKLNIQISQIPEVPQPVSAQDALQYTSTVMAAGAAAVQQTEKHLTKPNAINKDIEAALEHFSRSPNQTNSDLTTAIAGLMERLDKALTPEQRAEMAGTILPMFFFAGDKEPIHPRVASGMGIDKMSPTELRALSIERTNTLARETVGEVNPHVYAKPSELVRRRISEISEAMPPQTKEQINLSVAVAEDAAGKRSFLIGTSERYGYLRGIEPELGETVIVGPNRHPVLDLLEHAEEQGLKIIDIGATRPIDETIAGKIAQSGAHVSTPFK